MLYHSTDTFLTHIKDKTYLVPYAQDICDKAPLLTLNEMGELIWKEIGDGADEEDLINKLSEIYETGEEDKEDFRADIKAFLHQLKKSGALKESFEKKKNCGIFVCEERTTEKGSACVLRAGGLSLLLNIKKEYLHDELTDFISGADEGAVIDQTVYLSSDKPDEPKEPPVIDDPLLKLYEYENGWLYHHPQNRSLTDMFVRFDGSICVMYYDPGKTDTLTDEIFFALRESFLLLASGRDMYCLHSASIDREGKALLFSGPSGMGKSTHTGLWNKYENTRYINGDLNLLCIEDGKAVVKGIPWCGTSGVHSTDTYPIYAVTLLSRGSANIVIPLCEAEKITGVFMRVTSPRFNEKMTRDILDFIERLNGLIKVKKLSCTVSEEAVKVIKNELFFGGGRIC